MSLDAHVVAQVGDLRIDVSVVVDTDRATVLAGPNGAGKTTFVRALAGLRPIDAGGITLDGRVLDDGRRAWVPPNRRGVGYVSQAGHLFPHRTVLDNVAYGADRQRARDVLEALDLGPLAGRFPRELSGGQSRLVAIARALARRPRLLLLDEPFAGLDASVRPSVRAALRRGLAATDALRVLVAHEPVDALTLGDRVLVLESGRAVQDGTPDDLRARPATRYVADLVGVNLLRGTLRGDRLVLDGGAELVVASPGAGRVLAVIHPRAVALHTEPPGGSPRNAFRGTVVHVDDEGDRLRVQLDGPVRLVAEVTHGAARELGITAGAALHASVKATEIVVHPD